MRALWLAALALLVAVSMPLGAASRHPSHTDGKRVVFAERQRQAVRDFYNAQMKAGTCPIGFVKHDEGCQAPSNPRRWEIGKPLPGAVVRFDLPPALVAKLGKPPAGHRYVRVGPDILLVSNRTRLVVDGIRDLGRSHTEVSRF
jgi:hypothetical protein